MEKYLKRYFWVLHVVLILLIALLGALAVTNLFAGALAPLMVTAPPPAAKAPSKSSATKPRRSLAPLADGAWRPDESNGVNTEKPEEETEEPVQIAEGEYPISDLPVALEGTLVSQPSEFSMAMLQDTKSKGTLLVSEGETFLDTVELVKIERDRILIKREGRVEQIDLEGTPGKGPARSSPLTKRSSTPLKPKVAAPSLSRRTVSRFDNLKSGISGKDGKYKVTRKVLNEVLTDPQKFREGAKARPYRKNGKFGGFELTRINKGSLLSNVGLQQGDVITGVNGKPLNSMNVALDLYSNLSKNKNISNMTIEVERNGSKKTLSYAVDE